MHTLNKKLALLNSARAVLRIYTNPHRLVERTLSSVILCGRLRKSCCINVLQWAKFPFQLLVPTPGSHLPVPSFVPMQLCQWPHSTSDRRKNLSQLLSCCWTTVQENKLPEQAVIPQGCPWTASMPLWQHGSDRSSPAVQQSTFIWWQWPLVPNIAQLLHRVSPVLLNPGAEDRLQSYRAPKPGCLLRELSAPAKMKPAAGVRPRLEHQALENKTQEVCGLFLQHLNTEVISGHQRLFKAAGGHELKDDGLLFSSWGWCVPQDSVLCFLTIIWENIQIMSETGEFWGILALLFWVQNYWHLAPNWHHSQKQNSWLKGLFFFLPQYSFHLPHSL